MTDVDLNPLRVVQWMPHWKGRLREKCLPLTLFSRVWEDIEGLYIRTHLHPHVLINFRRETISFLSRNIGWLFSIYILSKQGNYVLR